MSGIRLVPISARASLSCDARGCPATWSSSPFENPTRSFLVEEAQPAFNLGWRVFAGKRTQHTYCPEHHPASPMRLVCGFPDWVRDLAPEPTSTGTVR